MIYKSVHDWREYKKVNEECKYLTRKFDKQFFNLLNSKDKTKAFFADRIRWNVGQVVINISKRYCVYRNVILIRYHLEVYEI